MEFLKNWYFLIIMLTLASVGVFVWLFVNRTKLNAKWREILIVTILHVFVGVGTVKFWALLEAGFNVEKAGNMSLFGGIFIMPLFYFVYAKIKRLKVLDVFNIFSVCLAFTLLCARLNCFHSGCCYGIKLGNGDFRFPTREIELVFYLVFIIYSVYKIINEKKYINRYVMFVLEYGIFRFGIEWLRESESKSVFHIGHIWAITCILIGTLLVVLYVIKNKKGDANENE